MAHVVAALLPYQLRAQWRSLARRGAFRGAEVAIFAVACLLALPGHAALCVAAASRLRAGELEMGLLLTSAVLTNLLVAWITVPILLQSIDIARPAFAPARLAQFPLSAAQIFAVMISGSLVQPVYAALAILSALSLAPLAAAPNPIAGVAAGAIFVAASALLSWAIALALSAVLASRRAREAATALLLVLIVAVAFVARIDFTLEDAGLVMRFRGEERLLVNRSGTEGALLALGRWSPATLAARAAAGRDAAAPIVALAALAAAAFGVAVLSVRRMLLHPIAGVASAGRKTRAISGWPFAPAPFGAAAAKELRYLLRTMDAWMGFAVGAAGAVFIALRASAPDVALLGLASLVAVAEMAIPLNAFGLDRGGVDRYRLLPLTGAQIVASKNAAAFALVAMQTLPLWAAGAARFGLASTLTMLCCVASAVVLTAAWGNVVSVRAPAPRHFYNFDRVDQAGGAAGVVVGLAIWVAAAGVWFALDAAGAPALLAGEAAALAIAAAFYRATLPRAGARFDASAEAMRAPGELRRAAPPIACRPPRGAPSRACRVLASCRAACAER